MTDQPTPRPADDTPDPDPTGPADRPQFTQPAADGTPDEYAAIDAWINEEDEPPTPEPVPTAPTPVLVLGDLDTLQGMTGPTPAIPGPLPTAAAGHGLVIVDMVGFDVGGLTGQTCATGHPAVVDAVRRCLTRGIGLWVPFPGDLGDPRTIVGLVGTAASLGITVFVDGPCPVPWQSVLLPGLAAGDTVAAVAESTQQFIATAGSDLMVTALIDAVRHDNAA